MTRFFQVMFGLALLALAALLVLILGAEANASRLMQDGLARQAQEAHLFSSQLQTLVAPVALGALITGGIAGMLARLDRLIEAVGQRERI